MLIVILALSCEHFDLQLRLHWYSVRSIRYKNSHVMGLSHVHEHEHVHEPGSYCLLDSGGEPRITLSEEKTIKELPVTL